MNHTKTKLSERKIPIMIVAFLLLLVLGSLIFLLLPREEKAAYIADIYQKGSLILSIPLYEQEEVRRFEITGDNDCYNTIEVCPGSIAIVSADCPDQICVHQGAIHNSLLPITCLPNRLVIQLRAVDTPKGDTDTSSGPDILTH